MPSNFIFRILQASRRSCTVAALVDELLKAKEADGASTRYLGDLRGRLKQFAERVRRSICRSISAPQIDVWLRSLCDKHHWQPSLTCNAQSYSTASCCAVQFRQRPWLLRRESGGANARAKEIETPVGILSVGQTARLLEFAPAELVPYIAIGAFAGLRRAEIERLDWKEVDLHSNLIEVTAINSKSCSSPFRQDPA